MNSPRPKRHCEKRSDEAIQKTVTGLPCSRWSLAVTIQKVLCILVLTLTVLGMQASIAKACVVGWVSENPEQIINDAYFIGLVQVIKLTTENDSNKPNSATVLPVQSYKKAPNFEDGPIKIDQFWYGKLCDKTPVPNEQGSYIEVVILGEKDSTGKTRYVLGTGSLGKPIADLRAKAKKDERLKKIEQECIKHNGHWSAALGFGSYFATSFKCTQH